VDYCSGLSEQKPLMGTWFAVEEVVALEKTLTVLRITRNCLEVPVGIHCLQPSPGWLGFGRISTQSGCC
jgi:uncharacterized radical SAM superfamily protein